MTSSTPSAADRLEAQVIAGLEFLREPVKASLRRRLAEDDARRRRRAKQEKAR